MDFIDKFKSALPEEVNFDDLYDLAPADLWKSDPRKAGVIALERADCFDSEAYLKKYSDVRDCGIEPLGHFVFNGIDEKRLFFQKENKKRWYNKKHVMLSGSNNVSNKHEINIIEDKKIHNNNDNFSFEKILPINNLKLIDNYINIVYIFDENFFMPTYISFVSAIKNKIKESNYRFILLNNISNDKIIDYFFKFTSKNIIIDQLKFTTDFNYIKHKSSEFLCATKSSLLKFFLPIIFKNFDKILYIDGDTLIVKDLSKLYFSDIDGFYAGVIRDLPQCISDKQFFGIDDAYFNSGVLLLNLKKMRIDNITKKLVNKKIELSDDKLMDQNVLNIVLRDNVKQLDAIYNFPILNLYSFTKHYKLTTINKLYNKKYKSLSEFQNESVIIHFSSHNKPWKFFDSPGSSLWLRYYFTANIHKTYTLLRNSILKDNENYISKHDNMLPIVFSTNNSYIQPLCTAITSIRFNTINKHKLKFFILHTDLERKNIDILESLYPDLEIKCINVLNMLPSNLMTCAHYSKEMYYRALIPEIFCHYNKVLYLDCDIIALCDVSDLFSFNIKNYSIAAVKNLYSLHMKQRIESTLDIKCENYVNSGVILFNTKECIIQEFSQKFFSALNSIKVLPCPDQDAINYIMKDKIYYLPSEYNYQWHFEIIDHNIDPGTLKKIKKVGKSAKIIHYTSGIKPWNSLNKPNSKPYYDNLIRLLKYINTNICQQ